MTGNVISIDTGKPIEPEQLMLDIKAMVPVQPAFDESSLSKTMGWLRGNFNYMNPRSFGDKTLSRALPFFRKPNFSAENIPYSLILTLDAPFLEDAGSDIDDDTFRKKHQLADSRLRDTFKMLVGLSCAMRAHPYLRDYIGVEFIDQNGKRSTPVGIEEFLYLPYRAEELDEMVEANALPDHIVAAMEAPHKNDEGKSRHMMSLGRLSVDQNREVVINVCEGRTRREVHFNEESLLFVPDMPRAQLPSCDGP